MALPRPPNCCARILDLTDTKHHTVCHCVPSLRNFNQKHLISWTLSDLALVPSDTRHNHGPGPTAVPLGRASVPPLRTRMYFVLAELSNPRCRARSGSDRPSAAHIALPHHNERMVPEAPRAAPPFRPGLCCQVVCQSFLARLMPSHRSCHRDVVQARPQQSALPAVAAVVCCMPDARATRRQTATHICPGERIGRTCQSLPCASVWSTYRGSACIKHPVSGLHPAIGSSY